MDFKNFISEEQGSTAVMAFGRYNPPTIGHQKLINKVHEVAKEHNGEAHVIASHSENTAKDPLPQDKKIGYLKKVAPAGVRVSGSSKEHPSLFHAASKLHAAGHKHLVVVAGSDRVGEYEKTLKKYNGVEGKHGYYKFKSIKVVSAGQRDPDAEGAEGMSGTKLRGHARAGEMDKFKSGLPKEIHSHAKEIAKHIQSIKEDYENPYRFDDGTPEGTEYMRKMTPGEKKEATEVKQDSQIKGRPGTQPAKYYSGMSKSTKVARDAQFKKQAKMDSKDPAAYKPAPGDNAETIPSKYTQAFKRKFGENKLPVLLVDMKKLYEEATEVEYDTIKTKNFDICPSAYDAFTKHIEDANNNVLFMNTTYFVGGRMEEDPLLKQRELLKAAIEATDGYLGVEKAASKSGKALPAMIVDFNYYVKRAMQSLELLGVLDQHDYIQSHIDEMAKLSSNEVKMDYRGIIPTTTKMTFSQKMNAVNEEVQLDEAAEKGLAAKADKSGVSIGTLRKVYKRGVAAWRTGHRPGTTPQQWGMARVNSYIMKGKTYHTADKDLREETEEITDQDLDKIVEDLGWEDIVDLYNDDELFSDDSEELDESLSMQARLKKKQSFARFRGKRGVAKGLKLHRASDMATLQRRAKVAARNALYRRFLKGRDKSQLSASEKDRLEQQVGRLKVIQSTLAQKLMPKIRSIEQKRLASYRATKR